MQVPDLTCSPPAGHLYTHQHAINPSICCAAIPKSCYFSFAIMGAISIGTIRVERPILAPEHHQGTLAMVPMGNLPSDSGVDSPGILERSVERQTRGYSGNLDSCRIRRVERRAAYRHLFYTYRNGRKLHTGRRNHGDGAGCETVSGRQDRKTAREIPRRGQRKRTRRRKGSIGGAGQSMEPKAA